MTRKAINKPVDITKVGFKHNLETFPRRMEYQGKTYYFVDAGLQCIVKSGERVARIFTMSDGKADYRLKNERENSHWTLLSISV